jgi:hypothetical protein
MDKNILSCSKCGHTLSETAEACAYCGTVVSSADSPPQPDEGGQDLTAQPVETPPSTDDSPPVLDMTDELAATPAVSGEKPEAESSSQNQPEETRRIINESAADAVSGADAPPSEADDQIDFQLPDDELIVGFGADETAKDPEPASVEDTVSAGIKKPELEPDTSFDQDKIVDLETHAEQAAAEVIPLADKVSAKSDTDDAPGLPQTPVLEVSGEDPSESETLGADILELVADEASEPETKQDQTSENTASSDEAAVEKKAETAPDLTPDDLDIKDGELEAILLTSDDEVQSGTPSSPEESEKPVELAAATAAVAAKSDDSSAPGEAQAKADVIQKQSEAQASVAAVKIEKAAQGLAEGPKKQKAASDATLLKKQKAALAKAQALKKKKLKLAKAQALKRKKAALVKAQALKKQKEAQAGIEKTNKAMATGSTVIQSMEANTKMLGLLKKYEGQTIGINYDNSADIKEAELVEANDEFFSVFVKDQELSYRHPLKTILTIIEGQDGVDAGKPEQKAKFNAVVKVYPLVLF